MDEIQVQPLSSSEVLDLLLGVGLDRAQAVALMGNRPQGQRYGGQEECEPSHTIQRDQGTGRSEFECTVMETMQRLSQRLDSLAEKVEGNDEWNNMTESPLNVGILLTLWADRPLDKPRLLADSQVERREAHRYGEQDVSTGVREHPKGDKGCFWVAAE